VTELRTDHDSGDDERTTLLWFLDQHRRILARKAEGLTDEQARTTISPSDLSLLGLIRHMADVERSWFRRALTGESDAGPIFYGAADPGGDLDGDFHAPADATLADAFAAYWAEIEVADRNIAAASLDHTFSTSHGQGKLRWIVVHMIEEYARHCGHADLLRQMVDGATGD
jgi:uncharacterized damage-inducible protein DinB